MSYGKTAGLIFTLCLYIMAPVSLLIAMMAFSHLPHTRFAYISALCPVTFMIISGFMFYSYSQNEFLSEQLTPIVKEQWLIYKQSLILFGLAIMFSVVTIWEDPMDKINDTYAFLAATAWIAITFYSAGFLGLRKILKLSGDNTTSFIG